ncbi:MAG: hypothetical protein IPO85_15700 [Saprospiraceae bacterium]|uniref:Uncharacterized protein n=1 Tax=Candidatus Defluviibacterium haderslevense TaxID=2981993 RepID=A0A9D7SAR3_9BACT|nr:hypothetical protein [Candidatus Defluviibacterium haderslevense]
MITIKEKIINGIQSINNEELLQEIYTLFQDIQETKKIIILNSEQKLEIEEARNDYKNNRFYSTEETFKDLLDD